jgi:uncharacterized protein YwbE
MKSQSKNDDNNNFEWYKLNTTILGVREKKSGGFSIKIGKINNLNNQEDIKEDIKSFTTLLKKILDYYKYQFMTFNTNIKGLKENIKNLYEKELRTIGFGTYQGNNYVFQEKPKIGDIVLIAIKPYIGRYEKGPVKRILTGARYHPRGYKVMLNDKENMIGRIATVRKENHQKEIK